MDPNPNLFDPASPEETSDLEELTRAQVKLDLARAAERARASVSQPGGLLVDLQGAAARLAARASTPEYLASLEAREREAAARERRALQALARACEVPEDEDLRAVVLDPAPTHTPALTWARSVLAWRGERRRGCVAMIGGPRGVGKSVAAAWALLRCDSTGLYVQAPEIGATPRNGFSENEARWARWLGVGALVLDDLGTEGADPEVLAGLLWQRYDRGWLTLVTTNLSRGQVAERYFRGELGSRLADRLVNAQGQATGKVSPGPGGFPWYTAVTGASLRNAAARAELTEVGR